MWIQPSTFSVSLALAATSSALVLRGEPYPSHSLQLRQKGKSRISAEAYSAPDDGVGLEELTRPDQTIRFVSNITVNGETFRVLIDTGSSDLSILTSPTLKFNDTGIPLVLLFGSAAAPTNISGNIGFAEVQLGDYTVSQQAFLNATSIGTGGVTQVGLSGLIGLGFDGQVASPITNKLVESGIAETFGQPFLFNVFDETPEQNNFMGISLSRTGDLEGSAEASFTINEIDEDYAAVANAPLVPVFPPSWNFLVDGIFVGQDLLPFPLSTVKGTPAGKAVVLMDTGNPSGTFPKSVVDALYSSIPGSVFSESDGAWVVPCNTTTIVTFSIGGQFFPIHPLDLSDTVVDPRTGNLLVDANEDPKCFQTVFGADLNPGVFDMVFGAALMRNWYTVFNFGNTVAKSVTGDSSIQLLSQTIPEEAVNDVTQVRMARLAQLGSTSSSGNTGAAKSAGAVSAAVGDFAASGSASDSDSQLKKYGPIVIGLLGANLLVLLVLLVLGFMTCRKQRGGRSHGPNYVPVKIRDEEPSTSGMYYKDT